MATYNVVWCVLLFSTFINQLTAQSNTVAGHDYRVVCYFTNWAQYRSGAARFTVANLDPNLCTHLIFSFAKLSDSRTNELEPYEWNDESTGSVIGSYEAFNALKSDYPSLKTLLAVGGWTHGTQKFTYMAETTARREVFIRNAIDYLRERGFDGLDLDWEFPGFNESPSVDKGRFTSLVQELRVAFDAEALSSSQPPLLLSSACSASYSVIENGYEIQQVAEALDFINLMAYDLHGSWDSTTGHHTSLYPAPSDDDLNLNLEYAVKLWTEGGAPSEKLTLGLGLYGRSLTLADSDQTGIGAPIVGSGEPGLYTAEDGFWAYYEICKKLTEGMTSVWDNERKVTYGYQGDQWVGYDDPRGIAAKINFLKSKSLGGAMVWAIDLDDFWGQCGETWPLMKAINSELSADGVNATVFATSTEETGTYSSVTETSPGSSTTQYSSGSSPQPESTVLGDVQTAEVQSNNPVSPSQPASTPHQPPGFTCNGKPDRFYPDPEDCGAYYQCVTGNRYRTDCGSGLLWNQDALTCDWPENVDCTEGYYELTTQSGTQSFLPSGTDALASEFTCEGKSNGLYPDLHDCGAYYECANDRIYRTQCVSDLRWNQLILACDWPDNVACASFENSTASVTQSTTLEFTCNGRSDGLYPDPNDCGAYYECAHTSRYRTQCGSGLRWNQNIMACDWPENVDCTSGSTQTPAIDFTCDGRSDGYFPDPTDCGAYYQCSHNRMHRTECGSDLRWNQNVLACDWPESVQCDIGAVSSTQSSAGEFTCTGRSDGYYSDSGDCGGYYECVAGSYRRTACEVGLLWNQELNSCDLAQNVACPTMESAGQWRPASPSETDEAATPTTPPSPRLRTNLLRWFNKHVLRYIRNVQWIVAKYGKN